MRTGKGYARRAIIWNPGCTNVAFSLFGRKPPQTPIGGKAVVRPAAPTVPAPSTDEAGSLDFTRPGDLPSRENARIEVSEAAHQVPPAIEQAAMLHSIGQSEAACAELEAAVREQEMGAGAKRAWGMLFELYQELGRHADFERLAVEYAARFETSPPAWSSAVGRTAEEGSKAGVSLAIPVPAVVAAKVQEAVKQMFKAAEKGSLVKIDLGRMTEADEEGCALLNEALSQLKRKRKDTVIAGAEKAAAVLKKRLATGQREHEQAWILLLELLQQTGDQAAFEEAAVNYAITFEVSPPSWEPVRATRGNLPAAVRPDTGERAADCVLEGSITAGNDKLFTELRAQAEAAEGDVIVDASRLQRMDFVAATNLMNLVSALRLQQKRVRFVKASHLVTALWEIIGLDRIARIETRKT